MSEPLLSWKQTDPRTCGASALMVALSEASLSETNSTLEMDIWKYVNNGSACLPGSFAGRLAMYAFKKGLKVEIWEDREQLDRSLLLKPSQVFPELDLPAALAEHDTYLEEAAAMGIETHRMPLAINDIALKVRRGVVLMLVSTQEEQTGLHWVLVRNFKSASRTVTVMDPGTGQNYEASEGSFCDHYQKVHPFMGVAVVLKTRDKT